MRARLILNEVGIGLRRNLTMTIALVITFAVSLGLLGGALLVRDQVDVMKDYWYDKVQVSIFLCTKNSDAASCSAGAVTDAQKDQIKADLESLRPLVQEVYYESSAEAYERFKEQFKNSPDRAERQPRRAARVVPREAVRPDEVRRHRLARSPGVPASTTSSTSAACSTSSSRCSAACSSSRCSSPAR